MLAVKKKKKRKVAVLCSLAPLSTYVFVWAINNSYIHTIHTCYQQICSSAVGCLVENKDSLKLAAYVIFSLKR